MYNNIESQITKEISPDHAEHVAFTSEIWTCMESKQSFISLSGHWIDEMFEPHSAILHGQHFPESHTGVNISDCFDEMWEQWNIDANRRHILVSNNKYMCLYIYCIMYFRCNLIIYY